MKNKLLAVFIFLMLTMSLGASLNIINLTEGQASPEIRVEPSTYEAAYIGEIFDIDITINDVDSLLRMTSVEFRLKYNETLLEVVTVTEGPFLKQFNNTPTLPFTYFIWYLEPGDVGLGYPHVLVGIQLLPNAEGEWTNFPSGSGILATITFKVIKRTMEPEPVVTCDLALTTSMILNDDLTEIEHSTVDGSYQAPHHTLPMLRVEPSTYHPTVSDEVFTVDVTINNLDPTLKAVSVEFRLSYDGTLLEVQEVTEGSFLSDPRWNLYGTYFIHYDEPDGRYGSHVLVGILLLPNDATGEYDQTQFPEGSGTLVSITFKAVSVCTPCLFGFKESQILDANLEEIEHAPPLNTLSVEPSAYSAAGEGETFDVNVTISDLGVLWRAISVQFRLTYNDTLLKVVNVTEGPFMQQFGDTYFLSYLDTIIYGPHVLVGIQLLPNDTGQWEVFPYGSGTLATVTFEVLYGTIMPTPPASCLLDLKDTMILNDDIVEIEHYVEAAIYHAPHYPRALLSVEPSTYSATELDETFSVDVKISNLSPDLKAINVQFRLTYNATMLEVVDVVEGPFMQQFGDTFFLYFNEIDDQRYGTHVLVGIQLLPNDTGQWEVFPEGDGVLVTITFKAIYQHRGLEKPPLCFNLEFVDTMILDEDLVELPFETEPGQYCILPRHVADLNDDGKVDMKDIGIVAKAFGSYPGHERWDPLADINEDGKVDMRDVAGVARLFGYGAT